MSADERIFITPSELERFAEALERDLGGRLGRLEGRLAALERREHGDSTLLAQLDERLSGRALRAEQAILRLEDRLEALETRGDEYASLEGDVRSLERRYRELDRDVRTLERGR